jgi:hypothetical protein
MGDPNTMRRLPPIIAIALAFALAAPAPWTDWPQWSAARADDDDGGDDSDGGGDDGGGDDSDGDDDDGGGDDDDDDDDDGGRGRGRGRGGDDDARRGPLGFFDRLLGGASSDNDPLERVSNEILGVGLTQAQRAALTARGFGVIATRRLGGLGFTLDRLRVPAGLSLDDGLAAARAAAPGATFDFNHLYRGGGATCDPAACWGAELVRVAAAPPDACARGAAIAIVDTPVDMLHPALAGAVVVRRSFVPQGVEPAAPDHGTAVAALLVGRPAPGAPPLAPGARLLAAEAFALRDGEARADAAAVAAGLDWAAAERARVVGLSLAGPPNLVLAAAVAAAATRLNVVAAAGNDGPRADPAYPAAYPGAVAVAAVDARKRSWRGGNRGDYVEVAAPGVGVVSAGPDGGVRAWTGTSFAVPFAMAALLRARAETGGDLEAARALLARGAEDLGAPGRDPDTGHGLARAPGARCR